MSDLKVVLAGTGLFIGYFVISVFLFAFVILIPVEYAWANGWLSCNDYESKLCAKNIAMDALIKDIALYVLLFVLYPIFVFFYIRIVFKKAKYKVIPSVIMVVVSSMLIPLIYISMQSIDDGYLYLGIQLPIGIMAALYAAQRKIRNET